VTLQPKDRRNLVIIAAGIVLIFVVLRSNSDNASAPVVASVDSIPAAERRLERLRQLAATVPGKEAVLQKASVELQTREAGMLKAETTAQAQAQLLDVIRQAGTANGIDARGVEQMNVSPLANDYGEVSVAVTFACGIEQLVNFLADLDKQPQIVATKEIDINGGNDKNKSIRVTLSLSGVVPKKLAPNPKGGPTL